MSKFVSRTILLAGMLVFGISQGVNIAYSQEAEAANEPQAVEKQADRKAKKIALIRFGTPDSPQEINPFSEAFFNRKMEKAKEAGADLIVLEIDSPGGYVESSINMASTLLECEWAHTVAYIPREALSGAAIISLGADEILMRENAFIGDAGPIFMGEDFLFRHAPEKIRSDLVSKVRAFSEATGRPPAIAESMVDLDLEVFKVTHVDTGEVTYKSDAELDALEDPTEWTKGPLLEASKKGQFLEVTGREAVEVGLANAVVDSRAALAKRFDKEADNIVVLESTWIDTMVMILNFKFVTVLLFIIGLIALYVEFAAPGIGVGGIVSGLCFGLFFWSRFLGGTAGWLEVILFVAGIAFILVELFVIPGFGVAGISGALLMVTSLIMASQRFASADGLSSGGLINSLLLLLGAGVGSIVGMYVASKYFGGLKLFSHMTLEPPPAVAAAGTIAASIEPEKAVLSVGDEGVADSVLRPSGRALFADQYYDVVTDGSFVDKGTRIRVVKVSGTYVTVREIEHA